MSLVVITGVAGLVGSEAARFFGGLGFEVVGIDNDMRRYFFGEEASTYWQLQELRSSLSGFRCERADIRDNEAIQGIFARYGRNIALVIHTAAQPSHDWAAKEPLTDFTINANGTLVLLEAARMYCPDAPFIFTSTNKVYGDTPNRLPLRELPTRWEIAEDHPYFENGIDESMSIDQTKHSLFGASKVAADVMVQEYGRYFGMNTGVFRGGCLTGPRHSGTEMHGFLAYLMKCAATGRDYRIHGYQGKQVRDNIHAHDLVNAFYHFYRNPQGGEVYNIGGGRFSHCSMLEAIGLCEQIVGRRMKTQYREANRVGDHIWWVSDVSKFKAHYPDWTHTRNVEDILNEIYEANAERWAREESARAIPA